MNGGTDCMGLFCPIHLWIRTIHGKGQLRLWASFSWWTKSEFTRPHGRTRPGGWVHRGTGESSDLGISIVNLLLYTYGGYPTSSILMGFSRTKTIHFGVPPFLETPMYMIIHDIPTSSQIVQPFSTAMRWLCNTLPNNRPPKPSPFGPKLEKGRHFSAGNGWPVQKIGSSLCCKDGKTWRVRKHQ